MNLRTSVKFHAQWLMVMSFITLGLTLITAKQLHGIRGKIRLMDKEISQCIKR